MSFICIFLRFGVFLDNGPVSITGSFAIQFERTWSGGKGAFHYSSFDETLWWRLTTVCIF